MPATTASTASRSIARLVELVKRVTVMSQKGGDVWKRGGVNYRCLDFLINGLTRTRNGISVSS